MVLEAKLENLNYSAEVLKKGEIFSYFGNHKDEAEQYGRTTGKNGHKADQEAIANRVYANRNGNGNIETGDGWRYRGGGLIQVTGKSNYNSVNNTIKSVCSSFKTEITPENITNTRESVISAMAFWYSNNINSKADNGMEATNVDSVTKMINSGELSTGKASRRSYFNTLKTKWSLTTCKNYKEKKMKKNNIIFLIVIVMQLNLFADEFSNQVLFYSFKDKQLQDYQLLVKTQTVDTDKMFDNVKLIQIMKNQNVLAEYKTIQLTDDNLGEGFNSVEILNKGFNILQTFRDGRYLVVSYLKIQYEGEKFLLKEYREQVTDVYSDNQDFETAEISLEKGIPIDCVSDDLIFIFHSSLMLNSFTYIYNN